MIVKAGNGKLRFQIVAEHKNTEFLFIYSQIIPKITIMPWKFDLSAVSDGSRSVSKD